jgi:hypothetical protein
MPLTFRLLARADAWPADTSSLAAAIRSQGPFEPVVTVTAEELVVQDPTRGLTTTAVFSADPVPALDRLTAADGYTVEAMDRDHDSDRPIQRVVTIHTADAADAAAATLFHVTVTDGLWWMLGGVLVDPYRKSVWGWRRWRTDQSLAAHAAAVDAARGATSAPAGGAS